MFFVARNNLRGCLVTDRKSINKPKKQKTKEWKRKAWKR